MRPSFKNIQDAVEQRTKKFTPQYFPLKEIFMKITEETGEVSKEISRLYAHKKEKGKGNIENLKLEIGDMLFAICCL
jgi:NTP pyrophosphatase (non-canonical NTP hydrolase)